LVGPSSRVVGNEPGERADRSEVGESPGVTETAGDLGRADDTDAGSGANDPGRVDLLVEDGDALVEPFDLLRDAQGEPGLDGDVVGERVEVHAIFTPQSQGRLGGIDDRVGAFVMPRAAAGTAEELGQTRSSELLDLGGVSCVAGQEPQRGQRHVRAQCRDPRRPHDLKHGVQPAHRGRAPVHQS
jgi:hypothetical protein